MDTQFVRDRITQLRLKKGVSEYQMSYDLGHSRSYVYTPASMRSRSGWSAVSAGPCIVAAHGHETGKNESYGAA